MGVELPLRVVVTILECCVTSSGVKLSIRSFVLLLEMISDNMAQKPLFYVHFWCLFGQTLLGHNIAMATPKIPGNKNYLKGCVIYKN